MSQGSPPRMEIVGLFPAESPPVIDTPWKRGNAASRMRTEIQSINQRRVGGWRGSFGTACGRDHFAAACWLPTTGDRKHRHSGYLEATVHAKSVAASWQFVARRGGLFCCRGLGSVQPLPCLTPHLQ